MPDCFFGIQVVMDGDGPRAAFAKLPRSPRVGARLNRDAIVNVARAMTSGLGASPLGYWDLVVGEGASGEYGSWWRDIESAPMSGSLAEDARLRIATLIVLAPHGGDAAREIAETCDLPEEAWWRRSTFRSLLRMMERLDYRAISADAVYLAPAGEGLGLTAEELQADGYGYLRKLA